MRLRFKGTNHHWNLHGYLLFKQKYWERSWRCDFPQGETVLINCAVKNSLALAHAKARPTLASCAAALFCRLLEDTTAQRSAGNLSCIVYTLSKTLPRAQDLTFCKTNEMNACISTRNLLFKTQLEVQQHMFFKSPSFSNGGKELAMRLAQHRF